MTNTLELLDQQIKELEEKAKNQPTDTNAELLETMRAIKKNQEIERKRYERDHAIKGDESIQDWEEADVGVGQRATFTYNVPEGWVFYWKYPSVSWNNNSTFYVYIDGALEPTLIDVVQDMGEHNQVFVPPKKCYSIAQIKVLNNDEEEHSYSVFFGGFIRRISKIDEIRSSEL